MSNQPVIVAVLNFSGNVGKTTVAGQCLAPRLNAPMFSVESINTDAAADGMEVERLRGKKYGELLGEIMKSGSAIVDVGASNVEEFLKYMQQYEGSHEEFTHFIIPVVKERKQQADTVNTIRALAAIGVPKKKIRVVFNKVELDDQVEDEFAPLFGLAKAESSFTLRPEAVIYNNEVFERLKGMGKTLADVMADDTDYRGQVQTAKDDDERDHFVKMVGLKRLGATATRNLDAAYTALIR